MVEQDSEHGAQSDGGVPIHHVERKVETHEEILDRHDRRITKNENWRLQARGALKFAAFVLGSGVLAFIGDAVLHLF